MILLKKIVESAVFRNAVFAVVLLNVVLLGVQCSAEWNQTAEIYLSRGLEACLAFFVVETVLKLVALRGNYFKNRWNCLDFAIVLASILAEMSGISSLRVLRLLRSALALKIFNGNGNIQRDLFSIFQSVPRIMGTMLLLQVIFFIFSVAGVAFFGEDFPDDFRVVANDKRGCHRKVSFGGSLFHSLRLFDFVHSDEYHRRNYRGCNQFRRTISQ